MESDGPSVPRSLTLKEKKQYKKGLQFPLLEGTAKRKDVIVNARKNARLMVLDAQRCIERDKKENLNTDKECAPTKTQNMNKNLGKKVDKEGKKVEKKTLKPFITGIVRAPISYVPLPPVHSNIKNKEPGTMARVKETIFKKQDLKNAERLKTNLLPSLPQTSISNLVTKSKKYTFKSMQEPPSKQKTVAKIPASQPGPSNPTKGKEVTTRKAPAKKVIKEGPTPAVKNEIILMYRKQLASKTNKILKMCDKWGTVLNTMSLPNSVQELVLVAMGQGRLLMTQKLEQFSSLIDLYKQGPKGARQVAPQDLHGFWDLVSIQVDEVNNRFKKLELLKENNWDENEEKIKKTEKKKKQSNKANTKDTKKSAATSCIRKLIGERRKALKAKKNKDDGVEDAKIFEAGVFNDQYSQPSTSFDKAFQCGENPMPAASLATAHVEEQIKVDEINNPKLLKEINSDKENIEKKQSNKGKAKDTIIKKAAGTSCLRKLIAERRKALNAKKNKDDGVEDAKIFEAGVFNDQYSQPSTSFDKAFQCGENPMPAASFATAPVEEQVDEVNNPKLLKENNLDKENIEKKQSNKGKAKDTILKKVAGTRCIRKFIEERRKALNAKKNKDDGVEDAKIFEAGVFNDQYLQPSTSLETVFWFGEYSLPAASSTKNP